MTQARAEHRRRSSAITASITPTMADATGTALDPRPRCKPVRRRSTQPLERRCGSEFRRCGTNRSSYRPISSDTRRLKGRAKPRRHDHHHGHSRTEEEHQRVKRKARRRFGDRASPTGVSGDSSSAKTMPATAPNRTIASDLRTPSKIN